VVEGACLLLETAYECEHRCRRYSHSSTSSLGSSFHWITPADAFQILMVVLELFAVDSQMIILPIDLQCGGCVCNGGLLDGLGSVLKIVAECRQTFIR
jgi:hypothetical protein